MKKNTFVALALGLVFAALTIFSTSTPALANSETSAVFNVPFEFYVGDKKVPAGKYEIQRVSIELFRIINDEKNVSVLIHASNLSNYQASSESTRLVFNTYGEQHFLSEIYSAAASGGRLIRASKTERNLQKETRNNNELAKSKTQQVVAPVKSE